MGLSHGIRHSTSRGASQAFLSLANALLVGCIRRWDPRDPHPQLHVPLPCHPGRFQCAIYDRLKLCTQCLFSCCQRPCAFDVEYIWSTPGVFNCLAFVLLRNIVNRADKVRIEVCCVWTSLDFCVSICRSLRDMMHALDLEGHAVHKPQLSTLAESPSQIASDTTSSGSDSASVTQSLKVGPRVNSLKRSPLGRSVVTALEAELDQVQQPCSNNPRSTVRRHLCTASKLLAVVLLHSGHNLLAFQHGKACIATAFPNTLLHSYNILSDCILLVECSDCDGGSC